MRVCTVLAERQPFPRNGVSGRNTQRQIYMVAHYQLQHKGTLAEIHFSGEGVAGVRLSLCMCLLVEIKGRDAEKGYCQG